MEVGHVISSEATHNMFSFILGSQRLIFIYVLMWECMQSLGSQKGAQEKELKTILGYGQSSREHMVGKQKQEYWGTKDLVDKEWGHGLEGVMGKKRTQVK